MEDLEEGVEPRAAAAAAEVSFLGGDVVFTFALTLGELFMG